jgi:hypothetical protein
MRLTRWITQTVRRLRWLAALGGAAAALAYDAQVVDVATNGAGTAFIGVGRLVFSNSTVSVSNNTATVIGGAGGGGTTN